MNNEELLNKYKESLSILCGDENVINYDFEVYEEKYKKIFHSHDIVEKSFSNIARIFCRDSLMYSRPCLFYRNNKWYKYNGNYNEQIQLNNAIELTNTELFKLIKRTMYNIEKNIIINQFLIPDAEYILNLENLTINKNHLIEYKNLNIHSQAYKEIKIILEYLLIIDEKLIMS